MKLNEWIAWPRAFGDAVARLDGYCIAYMQHEVLIGLVHGGEASFCHEPQEEKLLELHVFCESVSYRAMRKDRGFVFQRLGEPGESAFTYDEHMLMIGSGAPCEEEGFVTLQEKGRRITLPACLANSSVIIRNYFSFFPVDEETMPGCDVARTLDWRYVGFADKEVCQLGSDAL